MLDQDILRSYYVSPIGIIELLANATHLVEVRFCETEQDSDSSSILFNAVNQFEEYFAGKRKEFELPVHFNGTDFQGRVWQELRNIPYGKTNNYKQLAINLGDEKCIRAAASANGANKIAIVVPCHRIIGSDGSLTGFRWGLERKQWLLDHESKVMNTYMKLF